MSHLVQFGCRKVLLVGDQAQNEINQTLQKIYATGQHLNWYMNYFYEKINEMRRRIEEQNEICAVNSKTFEPFRNRFRGKKVVIVATGPTVEYYEPIPDAIHIGINFAWRKEKIPLNYLFTGDNYLREDMELGFDRVTDGLFISKIVRRAPWSYLSYSEDFDLQRRNVHRFYVEDDIDYPMYQDIRYHPLWPRVTTTFSALQFALFTYPKEIYLVGCDLGTASHFYDADDAEKNMSGYPHSGSIKVCYARMKMLARQCYPETKIISLNPVGLRGLFHDVYTDNNPNKPVADNK